MSQVRGQRARRGGGMPASARRVSQSSEDSSSSTPIPWERQQQTRNLKNLFYNVCEDKRILKRRCEELTTDKTLLREHCDALGDRLHTTEHIAEALRRDSRELRYFKHISLKAIQRAKRFQDQLEDATKDLEDAAELFNNHVDQAAADSDALRERIHSLQAQLMRSLNKQREAGEGNAHRPACLQASKDEHIAFIEAELYRVKRESEADSISNEQQKVTQMNCISYLMGRLNELAPEYFLEAREAGIDPLWAAHGHVQHIVGPITDDRHRRAALQALTQRAEDLDAEREPVQAQNDEPQRAD
ncbi:hypothetical protein LEL_02643 [Akanthomyces lecanii RCEF 1005]|uniref:Uncharacterized protein n=1 Tax=Akanthomyces lecanii RCEF 1005 TaxID=1081108 RepID=A0A168IEA5_CORDF|nr:hypothetical protein LEL_02643 [Akanthomyces lecanii RCEF 1005]